MNNLGVYYEVVEENYDEAKKYYHMAIEKGNINSLNNIVLYYKRNEKDLTFIDLYKYQKLSDIFERFDYNITIPKKYHSSFCKWDLSQQSYMVRNKQYILKKTNIFPCHNVSEYFFHFVEILSFSQDKKCVLPKDLMLKIGGHLFI